MTDLLDEIEPPERPDFRRIGKGVPYVIDPASGERVRYRRSSSAGKILDDESQLVDWKLRTTVYGASYRPDLMALVSTLDPEADKKAIRDAAEDCLVTGKGKERQITGTAIHAMIDHIDLDHDWEPAPQFQAACDAYVKTRDAYGLIPIDVEVHCINDRYRMAGTMDRRYRTTRNLVAPDASTVPIGSVLAGDTKTGRTLEYAAGSYSTQLATYVDSCRYNVHTDERTPFDPPTFTEWAIIMHVIADDGRCDVYWVDLNAGRQALVLADAVRLWRSRTDLIVPAKAPLHIVPVIDVPAPVLNDPPADAALSVAPAVEAVVSPVAASTAPGRPDVAEWLRERIRAIVAADHGPWLARHWPVGVPGLKESGHTTAQLEAIEKVVDLAEAEFRMPFGAPNPQRVEQIASQRTWSDRWAKPKADDPPSLLELDTIRTALMDHPRQAMITDWSRRAIEGGFDPSIRDRYPLAHALLEFASIDAEWSNDQLTEMLDGTLRSIGYVHGVDDLGRVIETDAPKIMSMALGIAIGDAVLMYADDGTPRVRIVSK